MEMVMCRSCGEFLQAIPDGESLQPVNDECQSCGGTEFKDSQSGITFDTGE